MYSSINNKSVIFFIIYPMFIIGCSTFHSDELAVKDSYKYSINAFRSGNPQKALENFPEKEEGGFITTLEKAWLSAISGNPDPSPLVKIGANLEERKTISISDEARSFFYKEAADGYFPAEHEAILTHLVSGLSFAMRNEKKQARVEAKRAAYYLEHEFSHTGNYFDDPGLRLWLGVLWTYCEEWDLARVNFRVARKLSPNLDYLQSIEDMKEPPPEIILVLGGPGPEVVWDPKPQARVNLGLGNIDFKFSYKKNVFTITDAENQTIELDKTVSSQNWYSRHQQRNILIQDVLRDSSYMIKGLGGLTASAVTYSTGTIAATTLITAGIVFGTAIFAGSVALAVYIKAEGDLATSILGLGAAGGGYVGGKMVRAGSNVYKESSSQAQKFVQDELDTSIYYRFVRFLPEKIALAFLEKGLKSPKLAVNRGFKEPFAQLRSVKTNIFLFHAVE